MKIFILLINMIYYVTTFVIYQNPTPESVYIKLPKGAKKLDKEHISSYVKKEFKNSEITQETKNVHNIDDVLIGFWEIKGSINNKRSLEQIKSEALELFKLNPNLKVSDSNIITVNNRKFFILKYENEGVSYYRFNSDYGTNNRSISGILQFNSSDNDKASTILKKLLANVQFVKRD